jgi:hypothetical protein
MEALSGVSALLFLSVVILGYHTLLYAREKKKKELMSFCMQSDINTWVGSAQRNLKCDEKYLVAYKDSDLRFILENFQFNIARLYLDTLPRLEIKNTDFENQTAFLLRQLFYYLEGNTNFREKEMYEIGADGNRVLSKFGLTYFRTLHTTILYCFPDEKKSAYIYEIENMIDEKIESDAKKEKTQKSTAKRKPAQAKSK